MTLGQIIEYLERYPVDHPTNVAIRWVNGSATTFCVAWAPSTAGVLLQAFKAAHVTSDCLHDTPRIDDGENPIEAASPLLLRAWLGPVPVVLPDGCGVNIGTGAREYLEDHLLLTDMGEDGLMIEKGCIRHFIAPATLQWLRTGEVMP